MRKALSVVTLLAASIIPAFGMAAEPLGRLFFTPAQRSVLDAGKHVATRAPAVPAPRTVHLTGVVTRSDAENTVWINGTAYHDASPAGVQIKTDRSAPESTAIRIPGKTATTRVKVGQQVDLNSGRIQEDFARRPAATEGAAAPVENPVVRPVTEKKSKTTESTAAAAGGKGGNPATVAR
jgi:hypothetical protein